MVLGQLDIHIEKKRILTTIYYAASYHTKINSRWVIALNVKQFSFQKKIMENVIMIGKDILSRAQEALAIKERNW